jgi:hypothetical protein
LYHRFDNVYILESVEGPKKLAQYSFIGFDPKLTLCIKNGKAVNMTLGELVDEMGPDDVYIKSGNALDPFGNVGVLAGNAVEGGTFGLVLSSFRRKKFKIVFPIGLEKLIPNSVLDVCKETGIRRMDYSMGIPCTLLAVKGTDIEVVTEVDAIKILTQAEAIQIGAGGLMGAEGGITMVIKGTRERVLKAVKIIEEIKPALGTLTSSIPKQVIKIEIYTATRHSRTRICIIC